MYDFDNSAEIPAGLLRRVWLEDGQGISKLYAELKYDEAGRLQRVQNGLPANRTVVGLTYSYGIHDELRSIHHDGDRNPETFDYSCCGRVSRWVVVK